MSDGQLAAIEVEIRSLHDKLALIREADKRALELQAKEYERRLDDLNHSRALAEKRYGEYVPRETHAADLLLRDTKIDNVTRSMYIAVGILITVEFLVPIFIMLLLKH
jgi:hypothetical protein